MKSTESDVCYCEVNAVFNVEIVELLRRIHVLSGIHIIIIFLTPVLNSRGIKNYAMQYKKALLLLYYLIVHKVQ